MADWRIYPILSFCFLSLCGAPTCLGFSGPPNLHLAGDFARLSSTESRYCVGINRMRNLCKWSRRADVKQGVLSQHMIFDKLFGKREDKSEETPGKFVRHRHIENVDAAFGPRGIICAGFGEDELEVLAERMEQVLGGAEVCKRCDIFLIQELIIAIVS